ncbi:hypothetical protein AURDEDRAFT_168096 [Auricularia subglabra TFB-10046 SS5]|nr:hypothetical protein AURDEDRAFT_168096 [Auricularia subglabra TFB-10046 SS5]
MTGPPLDYAPVVRACRQRQLKALHLTVVTEVVDTVELLAGPNYEGDVAHCTGRGQRSRIELREDAQALDEDNARASSCARMRKADIGPSAAPNHSNCQIRASHLQLPAPRELTDHVLRWGEMRTAPAPPIRTPLLGPVALRPPSMMGNLMRLLEAHLPALLDCWTACD